MKSSHIFIGMLAVITLTSAGYSISANHTIKKQKVTIERLTLIANEARTQVEEAKAIAEKARKLAEEQRMIAERNAEQAAREANRAREIAEKNGSK